MEIEERVFSVRRVDWDRGANVSVHNDKDLNSLLGLSLEEAIKAPLLRDGRRASEILHNVNRSSSLRCRVGGKLTNSGDNHQS